jgi:hypothetical protein
MFYVERFFSEVIALQIKTRQGFFPAFVIALH